MKNNINAETRKYNLVQKMAGIPERDKELAEVNAELHKIKRNGAIAITATAVVGAVSTVTAAFVVKKKCETKYMTLPQIINLGKYAEYKELVNTIDTTLSAEKTAVAAANAEGADENAKKAAAAATKARKEAEEKFDNFMRIDNGGKKKKDDEDEGHDSKGKKKNKKKNNK